MLKVKSECCSVLNKKKTREPNNNQKENMKVVLKLSPFVVLLLLRQSIGQDIEPEFPDEYSSSSTTTTTTTTTITRRTPTTNEQNIDEDTTEIPSTQYESAGTTDPSKAPPIYTTSESPPIYNTLKPGSCNGQQQEYCYLKHQYEQILSTLSCGLASWTPMISCYRCCYYRHNCFAGCYKLHTGYCGYFY